MRTLALVLALFTTTLAFADADLSYAVTARKAQPLTGERVTFDVRIANAGPDAAADVVAIVTHSTFGTSLVDVVTPAGWQCQFTPYGSTARCTTSSLASGAEGVIAATFITASQPSARIFVGGTVSATTPDVNPSNNAANVLLSLIAAPRKADLHASGALEVSTRENSKFQLRFNVWNDGPDEARDVHAVVFLIAPVSPPGEPVTASGEGWTCENVALLQAVCTRPSLAAGANAPLDVHLKAGADEDRWSLNLLAFAELNHDPTLGHAFIPTFIGSPESWGMMLVPIVNTNIPGANGSLWKTDLTMLVRTNAEVEIRPGRCEFDAIPECVEVPPPSGKPIDPRPYGFVAADPTALGQFVYVRAEHFDNVLMNARIYDQSRETQTAGAELPIPRASQFTNGVITLMNIPVAPEYRHTLRIYDRDGHFGVKATIRIFANGETQPRVTIERTLQRSADSPAVTTARLPVHPAALQLELGQLLPLDGVESLHVEVEPLFEHVHFWAFVSITNNTTHHVTTVTPQ